MSDEDYVYDDESGEWLPASELAAKQAADAVVEVRDAVGNLLADGDQVTLIKDLDVKGAGQTLKQGPEGLQPVIVALARESDTFLERCHNKLGISSCDEVL